MVQAELSRSPAGAGRGGLTVLLLVTALVLPRAARADEPPEANGAMPRCGPLMDGQVYCKFGVIYECQLIDPNSLERRTGWRWKADILRSCARESPATMDQKAGMPPIVPYVPFYTDPALPTAASERRPSDR